MEELIQLLAAFARIALVPLLGYSVIWLARRWPWATLILLLVLLALGMAALGYAGQEGFRVDRDSRKMTFGSEIGRWCFAIGGAGVLLVLPALPLVAIARARNGTTRGPVGGQWVVVLYGYFMACLFCSIALYSGLTGIVK